MNEYWTELRTAAAKLLIDSAVPEPEALIAELSPCWIFHTNIIAWKDKGQKPFKEPEPGSSKFGGRPDLSIGTNWPLNERGQTLEFLAQIKLSDAPAIPEFPSSGLLLFFNGYDGESECIEHRILYIPQGEELAPANRPEGPRDENNLYDKDYYDVMPVNWVPTLSLKRQHRSFGISVYEYDLQNAIDAMALRQDGIDLSVMNKRGNCLSRFGGWPISLGERYADAVIDANEFFGYKPIATDWTQVLSLDSHQEIGMCFHDAGRYEFMARNSDGGQLSLERTPPISYHNIYLVG